MVLRFNPVVSYSASKHTISIYIGPLIFQFLSDEDLKTDSPAGFAWTGGDYDKNNLASANDLIGNISINTTTHANNAAYEKPLNLNPIRNIYIHSPNLGNFNTYGPRGENTIIKKVPVSNNFGEMIFDQFMASNDSLDCSRQTLKTLEFRLTDVNGIEIPFNGSYCSFSIVFNQMNPEM